MNVFFLGMIFGVACYGTVLGVLLCLSPRVRLARLIGLAWRFRRQRNLERRRAWKFKRQLVVTTLDLNETTCVNSILSARYSQHQRWIGKQMLANAARTKVPDHLPENL